MSIKIVHCKKEPYDIYIGRGSNSIWGNPFEIGVDGNRKDVIDKFRIYLENMPKLLKRLDELKDKTLGCHCKPKDCHGDVLKELVDGKDIITL